MIRPNIPHIKVVVAVCAYVLVGFAIVSGYVIGWSEDAVTKGNIIGTWQNFAMLAIGFWIGSSSGGKTKEDSPAGTPSETAAVTPADDITGEPK